MKEIIYQGTDMVKSFGETTVLQGISLKPHKGDFMVIMGSSGQQSDTGGKYTHGGVDLWRHV